jgi:hypothetical protein
VAVNVANAGTNHHSGNNGNGHGRSFADGH